MHICDTYKHMEASFYIVLKKEKKKQNDFFSSLRKTLHVYLCGNMKLWHKLISAQWQN